MKPNSEERVEAIFDASAVRRRSTRGEVTAAIVFDSFAEPFANVRGAVDARQVAMNVEELDLHLKISSIPSQHQIVGQVFARNETQFLSSVRVHLLLNGKPFKTAWSDNFGQFQFDEVPEGLFRLQLDLPHLTVVGEITICEQT